MLRALNIPVRSTYIRINIYFLSFKTVIVLVVYHRSIFLSIGSIFAEALFYKK